MRFLYNVKDWFSGDGVDLYIDEEGNYLIEGDYFFIVVKQSGKHAYIVNELHELARLICKSEL